MEPATLWWCFSGLAIAFVISRLFTVPSHLRHFPRVPILPLLVSYLSCEVENVRINSLILPYANEKGEGFLVWALGRWMIHILDHKVRASCCYLAITYPPLARAPNIRENLSLYPKELPPDGLLLWRFIGASNILMSNGDRWKRHSRVIRDAFNHPCRGVHRPGQELI